MPRTVSRTMSGMLRWTSVEISPETTAMPVLTSVSQATRPPGSSPMIASRTPSEIWSATLSGCPSVTDSDVKRYSPSANGLEVMAGKTRGNLCSAGRSVLAPPVARAGDEVDDQRNPLHLVGLPHPVLQVVGPIAAEQLAVVDLDRDPRRPFSHLRRVEEAQPFAAFGRRRRLRDDVGDEAVQLRGRDPLRRLVSQLQRTRQQGADVAPALGRDRDHRRPQSQFALDPRPHVVDVGLGGRRIINSKQAGTARIYPQ